MCQDMSCHLRGADALRARLEENLQSIGKQDLTIRSASCLGRCDQAPAVAINDHIYARMTAAQIEEIIRGALSYGELPEPARSQRGLKCASDPYASAEHYGVVRKLVESRDWNSAFELLESSGLRGLGGAGFPPNQMATGSSGAGHGKVYRLQRGRE